MAETLGRQGGNELQREQSKDYLLDINTTLKPPTIFPSSGWICTQGGEISGGLFILRTK